MTRMVVILLILAASCGATGCTAVKALYQSNEQLLAGLAGKVSAPACAKVGASLQPGEAAPICAALSSCATALCPPQ